MSDMAGSAEQPDWMNSLLNKLIQKTLTGDGASDRHLMTLFAVTLQLRATSVLESRRVARSDDRAIARCLRLDAGPTHRGG